MTPPTTVTTVAQNTAPKPDVAKTMKSVDVTDLILKSRGKKNSGPSRNTMTISVILPTTHPSGQLYLHTNYLHTVQLAKVSYLVLC